MAERDESCKGVREIQICQASFFVFRNTKDIDSLQMSENKCLSIYVTNVIVTTKGRNK